MKRITLLAACALVAAVLAVLIFTVSREAASTTANDSRVTADGATTTSTAELDARDTSALEADPSRDIDAPAQGDVAGRSAAPDATRSLVFRGRVLAGSALCEDPTLEVLACRMATDREAAADAVERSDDDGSHSGRILARAPVAADGTFEIALAEGTQRAHFTVAGRYLYRADSVEVDVSGSAPSIELEAQVGTCILGEIELPAGSPVTAADLDGTRVRLRRSVEEYVGGGSGIEGVSRNVKCAGGKFEFRAVPVAGKYRVVLEPEKLAAFEGTLSDLVACQPRTLPVALLRGGTVRGIVRGPDKLGVGGAKVEASVAGMWFGFDNRDVREGKTQADGTFELEAVTPGKIVVTASADGMLESDKATIELADGGLTSGVEIVLSAGHSVSGQVTFADGTPAAGAEVNVSFDLSQMFGMNAFNAARGAEGKTTAGSEGRFEVTGLGEGPFTVRAEGLPASVAITDPKERSREMHKARTDKIAPDAKGIALVLHAPVGLTGRVADETGAPVTKFRLHAVRPSDGLMGNLGQESHEDSFEAQDGHFLLAGLETGKWELFAIAEGFAYPEPFAVALPREASEAEIVISLVHGATVRGHVRGSNGAPIAGASIEIDKGEPSWKSRVVQGPKKPGAKSNPDGTFTLDSLRPEPVKLVADDKEHAKSLPLELDLAAAAEVKDVVLVLRDGGTLTGEVFDDTGEPAPGLLVQMTDPKNFEQQTAFSGGRGEFKFEHLEPASWQVIAMPTNLFQAGGASDDTAGDSEKAMSMFSKMKMAMVDIKDGETTHVVLGAPPTDPVRVFGRVTHHGEPFAGSMVIFYREAKASLAGMKSATVDKDGNYSTVLDSAGAYQASVQKFAGSMQQQSVVEFACDIPLEKEFKLDFAMPTSRISGRVRDTHGDPAKGARISLHPETAIEGGTMWGGQYNELATDPDGRFDIQALRPGKYTLLVGGMSMGGMFGDDSVLGREVRGGLSLSEGEWMRDVDFRLKLPGSLEITVVDSAGAPQSEAAVFVRTEGGELVDRFSMVSSDAKGLALYGGLKPGRYTVTARKGALVAAESPRFAVEEGGKTPVKVVLTGGTMLIVTLVGEPEKPLKPSVSVTDDDGRELSSMLGLAELMKLFSEGGLSTTERRFGPFPPGRYKIQGTANGKTVTKTIQLTGQAERKLTLRFND